MFNRQEDRRLVDYVFKVAEAVITQNARQNDLRQQYGEMMAANRWVNQDIDGLVNNIVAALPALERKLARAGDQLQDWIDAAIAAMVDGHFAGVVLKSRSADRLDEQTFAEMKREAQAFVDIVDEGRGGRGGGGFGARGGGGGYERGGYTAASNIGAIGTGHSHRTNGGSEADLMNDSWAILAQQNVTDNLPAERQADLRPVERAEAPLSEAPIYREPTPPVASTVEGPDYTKADPWADFWREGEHWQAAHRSKWRLTEKLDDTIRRGIELVPKVYNINTHLKYYVMNERGEVREELIEVSDDNRYLSHQLRSSDDSEFRPAVRSAGLSLNPRNNQKPVQDVTGDDMFDADAAAPDLVDILGQIKDDEILPETDNVLIVDSLPAAVFSNRAKAIKLGLRVRAELSVRRTPVLVTSPDQAQLVDQINDAPTMTAAAEKMNELKHQFEPNLWHTLNDRISEEFRHATKYVFQYTGLTNAIKFAEHYPLAINHISAKRGAEFATNFASRIRYVLDRACGHLTDADIASGVSGLAEMDGIHAVVFADYQVVISLEYTLDQLGLGRALLDNAAGMAVTSTDHPKLHAAVSRVYRKLDDTFSSVRFRVVLSTSDNRTVEMVPYAAKTTAFVLALLS